MEKSLVVWEQEKAEALTGICTDIWRNARNELYLNLRFLDVALSSLLFAPDFQMEGVGTDGFVLRYSPQYLSRLYRKGRVYVNRAYLHMIFHCIFVHMDTRKNREKMIWSLACDIAVESVIDGLLIKALRLPPSPMRRELYQRIQGSVSVMNAQSIYAFLVEENLPEGRYQSLAREFYVDSHSLWEESGSRKPRANERKNRWDDIRQTMETEMETFSKKASDKAGGLLEQVRIENRERVDYQEFLRKFSVMRETMQVDTDAFDYIYYDYGLRTYGNMPLIEPLETKEIKRIQEFAIVIDTSMSCSGDLVQRFLTETYAVLSETESFFTKVNIHIIQCDERVQSDKKIENQKELSDYMAHLELLGQGGTDFRPAFEYVDQLIGKREFTNLKGLIYFTDGYGMFPRKMPPYETAFVFMRDDYSDVDVPPWAIKIILGSEEFDVQKEMKAEEESR